ncbi:hypothetical protein DDZ14_02705 [Maritimibacter sp. 55A14]|nr:hypothetical protein DDZ14_02705 [Maritimibacter sp. 55A14]
MLKQYEDHYAHLNPYMDGWLNEPVGVAQAGDAFCSREKLLRSEFYLDFLRVDEDAASGAGLPLFRDEGRFIGFGGHIPSRFAERWEADFVTLLSLLSPHLTQAFEINRALGGKALKEYAQSQALNTQDEFQTEVIVIDAARRVLYTSHSAQRRLCLGNIVYVDDRSRLYFVDDRLAGALKLAARSLIKGAALFPVRIDNLNLLAAESFAIQILPYKGDAATASALGAVCKVDEPCLMITIQPQPSDHRILERLVNRYGLTPAEAEVAVAIDTENSLSDIARERDVSVWTVRSQVKAIFNKFDVSRQTGIVRIVEQERRHL